MAFDDANQEMVLFGGLTEAGVRLDDTWTWDGDDWTLRSPARSPSARSGARMAFDPVSGQLILVGGTTTDGITGETWTWDGSNWTELHPATPAPAVALPSVATDPASGTVLLFGGSSGGSTRNWTWSWNGTNWTQQDPSTSPPARFGASMAYDYANQTMVLFSGAGDSVAHSDTWIWNGTTWTEMVPAESPPFIGAGSMAFSPAIQALIHLGGGPAVPGAGANTWTWNGSNWSQAVTNPSPPARFSAAMQMDAASGKVLLFGGLDAEGRALGDTWTFGLPDPPPTAEITSPVSGGVYEVGESVPVDFGCGAAPHGPQVSTCLGSDGSPAPRGLLDTSRAGGRTLRSFGLRPPLGDARQVPGLRVRLSASRRVDADISPRIVYGTPGGRKSFRYHSRTVRVNRVRKLRFRLPGRVQRQMLRSRGSVYGNRLTFQLRARIKARGDRPDCYKRPERLAYELPVVAVSGRVALRRR